jgi:hypothetical protein
MSPRLSMPVKHSATIASHWLASVSANQGKTGTEFNLGRIHLSSVNEFKLETQCKVSQLF